MDGRLLQKQKYVDGIPISFLSQGIYLIEVKTDKGTLRSTFKRISILQILQNSN
ncbi:MAG: hypothetical protein IPN14_05780 [Bacteroidetes bacterium]|nr:hypothetical protein [Bacteroidota bacterium]